MKYGILNNVYHKCKGTYYLFNFCIFRAKLTSIMVNCTSLIILLL